ncbi:MAG TPA: tRNA (guanine(46)-N(7))-methyltransferase TrmB [Alphaproteobacteria bacterium]|nr:tRNA (guanine(46)-N(7))-methyltransferase TrmB [Alphaproteobacteria bacterium]
MSAALPQHLYGRRKGKKLRAGQAALLETLLPRLRVELPPSGELLDPRLLFAPAPAAVWLEIGFGGGEHLAALARAHPSLGFIGCEPYQNGVAKLLAEIEREKLANLRIFPDDARLLLGHLQAGSLACVIALFPDPWPKLRHHRRRLIQRPSLDLLARAMVGGAELRLATDDGDYADAMRSELAAHGGFCGPEGGAAGPLARPPDWPPTRYEAKARKAGLQPQYLRYRRRREGPQNA